MLKYLMKFNYSSASWARMLAVTDDRSSTVAALLEHLGGKLESMHWEVEDTAAYVIAHLPDSLTLRCCRSRRSHQDGWFQGCPDISASHPGSTWRGGYPGQKFGGHLPRAWRVSYRVVVGLARGTGHPSGLTTTEAGQGNLGSEYSLCTQSRSHRATMWERRMVAAVVFGQAEVAHLANLHELADCPVDVFNRDAGPDPVLVERSMTSVGQPS